MRLALAQINTVVGDLDGNRHASARACWRRAPPGPTSSSSPSSPSPAIRPRTCCCGPASSAPPRRAVDQIAAPHARHHRARRRAVLRRRPLQRLRRARRRRDPRRLPQALPAELRRLRRGPLLRAGPRPAAAPLRRGRSSARRSARTCGSRARPRPTSRSPARSSSPTSRPRRSTSARTASARRCSRVRARDNSCFVAFCNAVGGQDELIFDGHSVVLDDEGDVLARAPGFEEALLVVDVDPRDAVGRRLRDVRRRALARERDRADAPVVTSVELPGPRAADRAASVAGAQLDELEQMRLALELGLRDYVDKNGFRDVVVGALRRDRLGADGRARRRGARRRARARRLDAVALLVRGDARRRAAARREPRHRLPRAADRAGRRRLRRGARAERFAGREPDLTEENLQARDPRRRC